MFELPLNNSAAGFCHNYGTLTQRLVGRWPDRVIIIHSVWKRFSRVVKVIVPCVIRVYGVVDVTITRCNTSRRMPTTHLSSRRTPTQNLMTITQCNTGAHFHVVLMGKLLLSSAFAWFSEVNDFQSGFDQFGKDRQAFGDLSEGDLRFMG